MKNYINQLNGQEQNALHFIKEKIAGHIKPLLIFCWNSHYNDSLQPNCVIPGLTTGNYTFSCNLLVVMPEGFLIPQNMQEDIHELAKPHAKVHAIIHAVDFVSKKLQEHNPFFNWIYTNSILLYECKKGLLQLPPLPCPEEQHKATSNYLTKPEIPGYQGEKLNYSATSFIIPAIVNYNTGKHSIGILITKNYVDVSDK